MSSSVTQQLKTRAIYHCEWNLERIVRCLELLDQDQVWFRSNENSLAIGNQLLHLAGNLRQWVIHSLGGEPDIRERSEEFTATEGMEKVELLQKLSLVVEECVKTISGLDEDELQRKRPVQFFTLSGTAVLLHAIEHFSYHTGQIIQQTKLLIDKPLNFYGGKDVDATN
ncbi:MAG: DinB family protein [Bacteroidota bacterium]